MNMQIEPKTLSTALSGVNQLVEECKMQLTDSGIQVQAVDAADVAMVDLKLSADAFDSYDVEPRTLGINLNRILTLINQIANQPTIDGENEDIVLTLDFDLKSRKLSLEGGIHSFSMALIDPDSIREEPDIPEFSMSAKAIIQKKFFDDCITAADTLDDKVIFGVDTDSDNFYMESHGDTDDWRMEMDENTGLESLETAPANAHFGLDYLKGFKKAVRTKNLVCIELDQDYPLRLSSSIANGDGDIAYNIAPRVEADS